MPRQLYISYHCILEALKHLSYPSQSQSGGGVEVHSDIHGLAHPVRLELRDHHSADLELSLCMLKFHGWQLDLVQ